MESSESTKNALCAIKQINQDSLQQLLEANNWELSFYEYYLQGHSSKVKTFTCKNLHHNPSIVSIQIVDSEDMLVNKKLSNICITFSAQGTQQLSTCLNITNNEYYSKISHQLKHVSNFSIGSINYDDISNLQLTLHCNLRYTYVEHAHSIYSLIKKICNDISLEMWDKLIALLPFREKNKAELQLEYNLEHQFNLLPLIQYDQEFTACLANIIDIATQLSEIQQSQYIFYIIAQDLTRLGFTEQAEEILTSTILRNEHMPFTADAAALATQILMGNNGENKRQNAQKSLQYALRSDVKNMSDLKYQLSLLGICMGDETFFYHLLAGKKIACATEDCEEFETLAADVFLQAITHMTETIYLSNQAIKELQDENQQQREKINRLEAQLAQQNLASSTVAFSSCVPLATYVSQSNNAITTEIENKTSLPSNNYL